MKLREHGTHDAYVNAPCRCGLCTEAHRAYMEVYRLRKNLRDRTRHVESETQLRDALTKPEVFWW